MIDINCYIKELLLQVMIVSCSRLLLESVYLNKYSITTEPESGLNLSPLVDMLRS